MRRKLADLNPSFVPELLEPDSLHVFVLFNLPAQPVFLRLVFRDHHFSGVDKTGQQSDPRDTRFYDVLDNGETLSETAVALHQPIFFVEQRKAIRNTLDRVLETSLLCRCPLHGLLVLGHVRADTAVAGESPALVEHRHAADAQPEFPSIPGGDRVAVSLEGSTGLQICKMGSPRLAAGIRPADLFAGLADDGPRGNAAQILPVR